MVEAIFKAMSKEAYRIALLPRTGLNAKDRQFSERVDLSKIGADLQSFAKSVKVLKRSG